MIRPQRNAFRDMIDLSGIWRAAPDPNGIGEVNGWQSGLNGPTLSLAVPGSLNEQLAEFGLMNFTGDMWLEKSVFVSKGFTIDRDLVLRFGSADYVATVWVNGFELGASGAQHLPFEFDVTNIVAPDTESLVIVRITTLLPLEGPTQRVSQADYVTEGRPKDEYLPTVRFDFFPYGGLNRPVYLLALPKTRLTEITIVPRLCGKGGAFDVSYQRPIDMTQRRKYPLLD